MLLVVDNVGKQRIASRDREGLLSHPTDPQHLLGDMMLKVKPSSSQRFDRLSSYVQSPLERGERPRPAPTVCPERNR